VTDPLTCPECGVSTEDINRASDEIERLRNELRQAHSLMHGTVAAQQALRLRAVLESIREIAAEALQ
jgi:hypothetical protein